jgi:hypothetical protein
MWKKAVLAYCNTLWEHLLGETEKYYKKIPVMTAGIQGENRMWDLQNKKQEC